jgi:small neutral amino acid transporter SnatA (MarC family)
MLLILLANLMLMLLGNKIVAILGRSGLSILSRVMGLILGQPRCRWSTAP